MNKNKGCFLGKIMGLCLIASLMSCGNQQELDRPVHAQIVDGHDVWQPHEYPFLVKIGPDGGPCGGAVIHRQWVMTAEHCAYGRPRVIAGEYDVRRYEGTEQVRQTVKMFQRPGADFAILKLDRPLTFNRYVQPIQLKDPSGPGGSTYFIAGWGMTDPRGKSQDSRPRIPKRYLGYITYPHHCAAVKEELCVKGIPNHQGEKPQACHGDSGSPMFFYQNRRYYAVAVVQDKSHNAKTECHDGHNLFAPVNKAWVDRIIAQH